MSFLQLMMLVAGCAYAGSAIGLWLEAKPWMAATFVLYALTIVTLYMASRTGS